MAALTTARAELAVVTRFEDLDDDTALALWRALLGVERRWQRPLSWLLVGIPTSCSGLALVGVHDVVAPLAVVFVAAYGASLIVLPLNAGLIREEGAQLGVSRTVLRQVRRLDVNTRSHVRDDDAFLVELHAAQAREQRHRAQPTAISTLRRMLTGP